MIYPLDVMFFHSFFHVYHRDSSIDLPHQAPGSTVNTTGAVGAVGAVGAGPRAEEDLSSHHPLALGIKPGELWRDKSRQLIDDGLFDDCIFFCYQYVYICI